MSKRFNCDVPRCPNGATWHGFGGKSHFCDVHKPDAESEAEKVPGREALDCPEGDGKRIAIFPKNPVPVMRRKKDYVPGDSGLFKRHDGTEFSERKQRQ